MEFKKIDEKKQQLDAKRPLPENTMKSIHENTLLEWTYHSNAIEGNTLSLKETKVVLEGITIAGKTLNEHLEAINHKDAILYIEDIVRDKEALTEFQIRNIHQIILKKIDDKNAGKYRQENVVISGAKHIPPYFLHVPGEMENLIKWYDENIEKIHAIELAANVHKEFVRIHPFVDGNGRTARLLMNFELMKKGYLPVIIKKENRLQYYELLDKAHTQEENKEFILFIADLEEEMLDSYLKIIKSGGQGNNA